MTIDAPFVAGKVRLGEVLLVSHEGDDSVGGDLKPFEHPGRVTKVADGRVTLTLAGEVLDAATLPRRRTAVTLAATWRSTTFDRQQTALARLVTDDDAISVAVLWGLLGQATPQLPVRVTSAREEAGLNSAQLQAFRNAAHPVSLLQGPPGTGKT